MAKLALLVFLLLAISGLTLGNNMLLMTSDTSAVVDNGDTNTMKAATKELAKEELTDAYSYYKQLQEMSRKFGLKEVAVVAKDHTLKCVFNGYPCINEDDCCSGRCYPGLTRLCL